MTELDVAMPSYDYSLKEENRRLRKMLDSLIRLLGREYGMRFVWGATNGKWYVKERRRMTDYDYNPYCYDMGERIMMSKDEYILELEATNDDLKTLVRDLRLQLGNAYDGKELVEFDERIGELGIKVG